MFPSTVVTDRLRLSGPLSDAVDLHEFYAVCSGDPSIDAVTQYLTWDPHETPQVTADFLADVAEQWNDATGAHYAIHPRDGEEGAGTFAGVTGIDVDWDRRRGTLGVWLRKRFWGRGYSGERAKALVAVAFDVLDLEVVAVVTDVANERSARAVERYVSDLGGREEGTIRNGVANADGSVVDVRRWSVTREEWREATGGAVPELSFG